MHIMDENNNHKDPVADFATFMYSKGYRGKYTLLHPGAGRPLVTGSLRSCLEKFLAGYELTERTKEKFELTTYADQGHTISCRFRLRFDEMKGFIIKEADIKQKSSEEKRYYRIDNNYQLPGAVAVQGLFPKPKPWDNYLKGKFRT